MSDTCPLIITFVILMMLLLISISNLVVGTKWDPETDDIDGYLKTSGIIGISISALILPCLYCLMLINTAKEVEEKVNRF